MQLNSYSISLINKRKQILQSGNLGIDRTKLNASSTMYWPNIYKDIDEVRIHCNACQKYRNLNPYKPLLLPEVPKDVWNKVVTDLFVYLTN